MSMPQMLCAARARASRCATASLPLLLLVWFGTPAWGQQFVEESSARFPQPNPSEYTNQLTIGDLDGDGDLDIVWANGGNFGSAGVDQKARVYINDGQGFFTDETDARTGGYAGLHRGVELGDADNDGDLDIVLVQDFQRPPGLLINDGDGFFANEADDRLPAINLSSSRGQFGDIDNDGDLDLFFTNGGTSRFGCGQYRVYENDGAGFYTDVTSTNFPLGNVCNNMDCVFGDIDNDFDIDIRTASTGTNNSRLYRNDGTGVFTQLSTIPSDSTCYSYDFGDIDGDGDLDLLGVNAGSGSTELMLENDGTGTYTNVSSQISPNPSQDDNDSKFLDYDNDGDLDMLIARLGSGGEKLYRNDGSGNFTQVFGVVQVISDSSLDIMVADLTGDGSYDVVSAQGESGNFQNRIYINNGPADTIPPHFVQIEQQPDTPDTTGPYVIRALILDHMTSDRNFFDKGIILNYVLAGGLPLQVAMRHSGGQVYRGEIPGLAAGSEVSYWIRATDHNSNTATSSTLSFSVTGGILGDADDDGDVDLDDMAGFLDCFTGPGRGVGAGCATFDFDGDGDVDFVDFALYQLAFTG